MSRKTIGQINVYFLISSAIFISMTIYLIYALVSFYPERGESVRINSLYSKAYLLSELMIKDQGYPENWDESSVARLGIASSQYELSRAKIAKMQSMCDSPDTAVTDRLLGSCGLADEIMEVRIEYLNGTSAMDCNPFKRDFENVYEGSRFAKMTRVATLEGEIVEVTIYVS